MNISLILAICACVFAVISIIIGLIALVKVISMEKSTHSVQYVPLEMMPEDKWATTDKEIEEINKTVKETNEEIFGV